MSNRFYIAAPPDTTVIELDKSQSHHLTKVMRRKTDEEVVLFDGCGVQYSAVIISAGSGKAKLRVVGRREISRELPRRVTLAIAPPKSGPMDEIVRRATELGVACFQPIYCRRSVARYSDFPKKLDKWRRITIEACKQCGRNLLPEIAQPVKFAQAIEDISGRNRSIMLHTGGDSRPISEILAETAQEDIAVFIGPEGGFAPEEIGLANKFGSPAARLFPQVLRTETAVLAALAIIACHTQ